MKKLLARGVGVEPRLGAAAGTGGVGGADHGLDFVPEGQERDEEPRLIGWADRAVSVGAAAIDPDRGQQMFREAWGAARDAMALSAAEVERLSGYLEFVSVPAAQHLIHQDECGDFLLIVLDGKVAIDRVQLQGRRARLAEARAGDVIGEMALLDSGGRSSSCETLTPCVLAVLDARRLKEMMQGEPRLALALLASLARRLSLRLRHVSARLSALLSGN